MDQQDYIRLYEKFLSGECTPEEKKLLDEYFDEFDFLDIPWNQEIGDDAEVEKRIFSKITSEVGRGKVKRLVKLKWIAAAASVLLFTFGAGWYVMYRNNQQQATVQNSITKNDILPGGNKAMLKLANGQTIVLDNAKNGILATQGNTVVNKTKNGQLVYSAGPRSAVQQTAYNTISTPRGGEYQVILPDGTKVLLNAASSLTYPTVFTGRERKVTLTGEGYFEVAHNAAKPFKVSSNGQMVEVLGTHFNINAYSDEPAVKTTLLEGSVRISRGGRMAVLKPGQQSRVAGNDPEINVAEVDARRVVAWKNGLFILDGDDIQHIMRLVSRWYDVDVAYRGTVPDDLFGGSVSRFSNVSELLNILQLTGKVHFKITGRKIIVSR